MPTEVTKLTSTKSRAKEFCRFVVIQGIKSNKKRERSIRVGRDRDQASLIRQQTQNSWNVFSRPWPQAEPSLIKPKPLLTKF